METINQPSNVQKAPHFITFLAQLVAQFKPLQVYQYAMFIQQVQVNSIFVEAQYKEQLVYYLFVITEDTASLAHEIQRFADQTYKEAKVVINAHGYEVLLQSLEARNKYFSTVLTYGELCYHREGVQCIKEVSVPNPKRWLGKAIVHWRKRNHMAQGFSEAAEHALAFNNERICLYLLYQATEQACMGLIWVFMGYQVDLRDIKCLLYICGCFSQETLQHFMGTVENQKLLDVMMKCFSQIGYENDFSLDGKSIYRFVELVQGFLELADGLCKERFKILESRLPKNRIALGEVKCD